MDDPAATQEVSALTQAIAKGDASAFACFYDAWFDRLHGMARSATGRDESFCLDVVQEAMIKIMRSMKRFENEEALGAWLRIIVLRCALDRLRADRRRAAREAGHARTRSGRQDVEREMDDRLAWLSDRLAELGPDRTLLLAMRYRLGATLEHIGRLVGLGPGAVDGRINRSLSQMRAAARESFDDP